MKCEKCGKKHDGSFGSGRFCGIQCANSRGKRSYKTRRKISETLSGGNEYVEKIKLKKCLYCGKALITGRKYCSTQCQHDFIYKQYIKKWKNGEVDGSKCNGLTVSNPVRRYLWQKYKGKCSKCGWNTPNVVTGRPVLEVEHIDGDSTNNKEENLDLICPNCHSLTPTYKALNKGNGRYHRMVRYREGKSF